MMDGGTMFYNIEKQRATARVAPTATVAVFDFDLNILTA
jgi:hypothetical protein